jgi:hypothetical protein
MRFLFACFLLVCMSHANSQALKVPPLPLTAANDSVYQRTYNLLNGGVRVVENRGVAVNDANWITKSVRQLTPRDIARASARTLGLGLGIGLVADLAANVRCKYDGTQWKCDRLTDTETRSLYSATLRNGSKVVGSPSQVYNAYVADEMQAFSKQAQANAWDGQTWAAIATGSPSCVESFPTVWDCSGAGVRITRNGQIQTSQLFSQRLFPSNQQVCPDGTTPVGTKCSTPQAQWQPSTEEQVADAIAPVLPAPASLPDLVRDLTKSIDLAPFTQPQALEGPAKVDLAPRVNTETSPAGVTTTTTITPSYALTYGGDTITYNYYETTQKSDGSTKVEDKEDPKPEPEVVPPGNPSFAAVPKLYERKYPDGFAGVWADKSAALQSTGIFSLLGSFVPSFGDGGCPLFSVGVPTMTGYTVMPIDVPCYVWGAVKAFILLTALFACRRIIFGG